MASNKLWYLQQIDLFEGLSEAELAQIAHSMQGKHYSHKQLLYTPYADVESVYLLKKGEITIYYSHEGKRLILDVLKPGSLFGNLNFQENKSPHFAEASKDAFVCAFSQQDLIHIFAKHPELVLRFFQYTAQRMGEYEDKMKGMLFDAKDKVLNQLELIQKKQKRFKWFAPQKISISHLSLSEHTGLSRETVTRALQALKKEGLIEVDAQGGILIISQ